MNIQIDNSEELRRKADELSFSLKEHDKVVLFTNANGWYINTLVKNLLKTKAERGCDLDRSSPMLVISTDDEGEQKCADLKFEHTLRVRIPDLNIDHLNTNTPAGTDEYTRLCFVKTVIIRTLLTWGYTVIYIDPDMAWMKTDVLNDLVDYLKPGLDFATAGTPDYINTNVMVIQPTPDSIQLFQLSVDDVNSVLECKTAYSDEDIIRDRLSAGACKWVTVDQQVYPNGNNSFKYKKTARLIHANCVKGLNNKIKLLRKCGGWLLPAEDDKTIHYRPPPPPPPPVVKSTKQQRWILPDGYKLVDETTTPTTTTTTAQTNRIPVTVPVAGTPSADRIPIPPGINPFAPLPDRQGFRVTNDYIDEISRTYFDEKPRVTKEYVRHITWVRT